MKEAYDEMILHCMQETPFEACGLLSGRGKNCETVWRMKNVERSEHSFAMDLGEMDRTFAAMNEAKQNFNGIYHSHPTALPTPSTEDIQYAVYPHAFYFIVSLKEPKPEVACYLIDKDGVTEVEIIIL
ncbi:M67 family metallopeptidase [Rossellomorea vietnamensis]|uniref:M67 family metallopeptidase n=2 Tax=Bacillaceae TaxID=186817 RepID=A0A5D4MD64_9BACI|nr:M67 family metallopeptidase [Bacillus sp. P14.5]TYR98965.1 M67 family metallopeptidase [Rossellomorea vietnamensis]